MHAHSLPMGRKRRVTDTFINIVFVYVGGRQGVCVFAYRPSWSARSESQGQTEREEPCLVLCPSPAPQRRCGRFSLIEEVYRYVPPLNDGA